MFWWLSTRSLSGQGSCTAFGDMKTDSSSPFPAACGTLSYRFQGGDGLLLDTHCQSHRRGR